MPASVTVRMYNQNNLGDCFLLKFDEGTKESFLLIDCGSYTSGNDDREREIAQSISDTVGKNPLTIVLTHQHKDHLTGFITAADIFSKMNIREVWFSYLDNPTGTEAEAMRTAFKNFWNKNGETVKKAKEKFKGVKPVEDMLEAKANIDLFGEVQTGGEAISNLLDWCNNQCEFLVPGRNFFMPGLPNKSVKIYVMGPPTDSKLLKKLDPSKDEAVHSLDSMLQLSSLDTAINLVDQALDTTTANNHVGYGLEFPFNKRFSYAASKIPMVVPAERPAGPETDNFRNMTILNNAYTEPENAWRQIEYEWLSELGRVSLHMNKYTNNSSLVLAFELVQNKKVLLFVGDAQIGNWSSWFDVKFEDSDVTAEELLSRTVLYKAGHHSSHNATLLKGLDMMNEKELVIMIPVNQKVSDKMGFSMMKKGMLAGYNRKAHGRVLRSDTVYHKPRANSKFNFPFAKKETDFKPKIKTAEDQAKKTHLYVEYVVK